MIAINPHNREGRLSSSMTAGIVSHGFRYFTRMGCSVVVVVVVTLILSMSLHLPTTNAWILRPMVSSHPPPPKCSSYHQPPQQRLSTLLQQRVTNMDASPSDVEVVVRSITSSTSSNNAEPPEEVYDYEIPDDAVIHIKPAAMRRLRELRDQRQREVSSKGHTSHDDDDEYLILRMGVRSGGCSGMSYVMDFCTNESIRVDDDQMDVYETDRIKCVVDSKSMLYLYGLQLDYSTQLIGGGFKFYNPNAEESCGCGSSFGV